MNNFNFRKFTEEELYNQIRKDPSYLLGLEIAYIDKQGKDNYGFLTEFTETQGRFNIHIKQNGLKHIVCSVGQPFQEGRFDLFWFMI